MAGMSTRFFRNNDVPWRIIEGEAVLINTQNNEVAHLNCVGAEVWNFLESGKQINEITDYISDQFEVDKGAAKKDIIEFLDKLTENNLIKCR